MDLGNKVSRNISLVLNGFGSSFWSLIFCSIGRLGVSVMFNKMVGMLTLVLVLLMQAPGRLSLGISFFFFNFFLEMVLAFGFGRTIGLGILPFFELFPCLYWLSSLHNAPISGILNNQSNESS